MLRFLIPAFLISPPFTLLGQSSPESLRVMRAIADLRAADSVPRPSTVEYCVKQRDKQPRRSLTPYCQSVLNGRLPRDTTIWFIPIKGDPAEEFARISKQPFAIRLDPHGVTCPTEAHPRGPGIGNRASVELRWVSEDSVHAYVRLDCSEPEENRARGFQGAYYLIQEYHVTRRSGRWVAVAGMITVT